MPELVLVKFPVRLPTYVVEEILPNDTAFVWVPSDELTNGELDEAKIRAKYRGQIWDRAGVVQDAKPELEPEG